MDKQEAFSHMVRGLHSQGWRQSVLRSRSGDSCEYMNREGLRCAVGHLLTEEEAKRATFQAGDVRNLADLMPELGFKPHLALLTSAQAAHDLSVSREDMRASFVDLAKRFGLTWPKDVPR